ncbi:DNA repair helicase XPB [Paenibacillus daejeonensis]|uniref:DNA repair helicase XPB n=1 Tax=Paenibacillus daejeonensis TaxID=135193 RepID=UPI000369A37D|nr:DNA repair helicase XPB [Paenibacillus daejeonensis]
MDIQDHRPLIVQADGTVLLDTRLPGAEEAAHALAAFAELIKRPGELHTYRITPLSVWNALSAGQEGGQIMERLATFSKYELPAAVETDLQAWINRYGKLQLVRDGEQLLLAGETDEPLRQALQDSLGSLFKSAVTEQGPWVVDGAQRGRLKQELLRLGYPVLDQAGYHAGESLPLELRKHGLSGMEFTLRDYQKQAVELFVQDGSIQGGSGVLVLPCGAGKTIVGIAALARLECATLILTSNATSVSQWQRELLDKTTLGEQDIGLYVGRERQVRPVTVATYQMMTHRTSGKTDYPHMRLFRERDWGLIIYDEVHLLPAPVFRLTAGLQATRRLGLTATLVREDGCAEDVFSLIGPKRYELPWRTLEARGALAELSCCEVRVPLCTSQDTTYRQAGARERLRIASENPAKLAVMEQLLGRHGDKPKLVIGQYLDQLSAAAERLRAPLITGKTPNEERERLFAAFKRGEVRTLIVSKVANFAVDLPDAAVAVQISGSFGSRQEEAQRIGRILRPKREDNRAWFYSIVTADTKETEFALRRQLFMIEQGYRYQLKRWPDERALSASGTSRGTGS